MCYNRKTSFEFCNSVNQNIPLTIKVKGEIMGIEDLLRAGENHKKHWETVFSRTAYDNQPYFKIHEDKVVTPNGGEGKYGFLKGNGVVTAVILDKDDNIYLVHQHRYPPDEYTWEVIQGGIRNGEKPLDACKREIREEAGVVAKSHELIFEFLPSPGFMSDKGYIFLVRDIVEEGEQRLDPTENILRKKVPFKMALEMSDKNILVDSATCLAILRVARKLGF